MSVWLLKLKEPTIDGYIWHQRMAASGTYRFTNDKWTATRFTDAEKNEYGLRHGVEWVEIFPKEEVTFTDLRERLADRPTWAHALTVIDVIEEQSRIDYDYWCNVYKWLTDKTYSTVHLRDKIMEPIRHVSVLVEIGKQFNPTTEWHNTWMPLDTAIHCIRNGMKIGE